MRHVIVVHPRFDAWWSFTADHLHALWSRTGPVEFLRLQDDLTLGDAVSDGGSVGQLVALGVRVTPDCSARFPNLTMAVFDSGEAAACFRAAGRPARTVETEKFWGQSVAEFALGLTLAALRRIPQTHRAIVSDLSPWNYDPPGGQGTPGQRSVQFGDDPRFVNGTIAGKRVRIVGLGNIGGRFSQWTRMLGADVAAWDPVVPDETFAGLGVRRENDLARLPCDADIFAPMMPLREKTRGIVTAGHIRSLPQGSLVVLVTRAQICDMPAIRARVLADELSLAADVFDVEPLPFDDPLLGRHNVVHTPHNAGRTIHANQAFAETLLGLLGQEVSA
jgi:phosphoglycerate dehydrogenase-like enzyme